MTDSVHTAPAERLNNLAVNLQQRFAGTGCEVVRAFSEITLIVPEEQLLFIAENLRDDDDFSFEELIDLCGVDYGTYGQSEWETEGASATGFGRGVDRDESVSEETGKRFAVVYHLLSIKNNLRLRLRVYAKGTHPTVNSVVDIWSSANWFEREAFDLYGILFKGHPDLRRILTDYGFIGYPFRKDFPLIGQVEMRYEPEKQRVIYEPVTSVEPRTLVPKVIRGRASVEKDGGESEETADA